MTTPKPDVRATLLKVIQEQQPKNPNDASLATNSVLPETARRLGAVYNIDLEQALLTQWHELFRTGYLAWGYNISNPNPPFFHLTAQGHQALAQLSRDPGNPDGYLRHVYSASVLNAIAKSYLEEGLRCYVASLYKAAAVMVGAAAERMILELRDLLLPQLAAVGRTAFEGFQRLEVKAVLEGLKTFFDSEKSRFPNPLREEYEAYWPAFTQQIRATRNEAGHPSSVDPVTPEAVHAALLIFPELSKLQNKLAKWIADELNGRGDR